MRYLLKLATIFLCFIPTFFLSRSKQAIVELALREQLATFAEKGRRPRITPADRGFSVILSKVLSGWRQTLVIVQPETVVRWHRKGFRLYWQSVSKPSPGWPPIPAEAQALIRRFANENGSRARKVRAELAKLGISIGLATVSRYLPKRDPNQINVSGGRRFFEITNTASPRRTSWSSRPLGSDPPSIAPRLRPKSLDCLESVASIIDTSGEMQHPSPDRHRGKAILASLDESRG